MAVPCLPHIRIRHLIIIIGYIHQFSTKHLEFISFRFLLFNIVSILFNIQNKYFLSYLSALHIKLGKILHNCNVN